MQSAKSGVSRVPGLPAKLISAPEASIRSCHVLTVTGKLGREGNTDFKRALLEYINIAIVKELIKVKTLK